jgi:hypothetical protein
MRKKFKNNPLLNSILLWFLLKCHGDTEGMGALMMKVRAFTEKLTTINMSISNVKHAIA